MEKAPVHRQMLTKIRDPNYLRSELQDRQSPKSGAKFSTDPQSTVFSKSANPLNVSPNSAICALFKAKTINPQT